MPKDSKKAEKSIINIINTSQKSIDIAMYSFTNKHIAKALKKAAKRGVQINIIYDKKSSQNKYSNLSYLAKYKNINSFTLEGKKSKNGQYKGKMHTKIALIDNKHVIWGSANWSKSAFSVHYEILEISDNQNKATTIKDFFNYMLSMAKPY